MLADQAKLFRGFQRRVFRGRHFRRGSSQFSVAQRAFTVPHAGLLCAALGCSNAPMRGSRGNQHFTRRGPRLAETAVITHHRYAVSGALSVVQAGRVPVYGRIERSVTHLHLLPVSLHLIGEDQRQAVDDSLPHVRNRAQNGHHALFIQGHPGVQRPGFFGGHDRAQTERRGGKQCAGGGQQFAPGQCQAGSISVRAGGRLGSVLHNLVRHPGENNKPSSARK